MALNAIASSIIARRGPILWIVGAAFLLAAAGISGRYFSVLRANATIRELNAHKDSAVDPASAPPEEVLARINESLWRDHIDNAEALLSNPLTTLPPKVRAHALYNIANARTIKGAALAQKGDLNGATALVSVAKAEYRAGLKLEPEDWDLKYNIDVAMRIVRDLPLGQAPDNTSPNAPKKLWTDLPGIPQGLP